MPYKAVKRAGGYVLVKPGSRKRAKGTGKHRSISAAYAQAAAIRHSERRRKRRS